MTTAIETDEYNGWRNRETWAVHLHLSNTQRLNQVSRELVRLGIERNRVSCAEMDIEATATGDMSHAGDYLREYVDLLTDTNEDYAEIAGRVILPDITRHDRSMMCRDCGSLWRVDWLRVAEAFAPESE